MSSVKTRNMIRREEAEWLNPETNPECVVYEERQETDIETTGSHQNDPLYIMDGERDDALFPVNIVVIKEELPSLTYEDLPSTSGEDMEIDNTFNEESAKSWDTTALTRPETPSTSLQIVSCRSVTNSDSQDAHQNGESERGENCGSEGENSNTIGTMQLLENSGFGSAKGKVDTLSEIGKLQTLFSDRSAENRTILQMLATLKTQLENERKETVKLTLENADLCIRLTERDVQVSSEREMNEILRSEINKLKQMLLEKEGQLSAERQKISTTFEALDKIKAFLSNSINTDVNAGPTSVISWAPKTLSASTMSQKQHLQGGAHHWQEDGSVIKFFRPSSDMINTTSGYNMETKAASTLREETRGDPLLIDKSSDARQHEGPHQVSSELASISNHCMTFNPNCVNPKEPTSQVGVDMNAKKSPKSSPGPVKHKKHSRKRTKKYTCSICSQAFKHEGTLLAHIRTH